MSRSHRLYRAARLACVLVALAGIASASAFAGQASARRIALGAYIPHVFEHPGMIDSYGRMTGRRPVIVGAYEQWKHQPFVRSELRGVWERGALPMITWEPWTLSGRAFRLRAIAAGRYDAYLRRSAKAAAAWGRPVLVRFAHEMNGNWYPWGRGGPGSSAGAFKRAWRHVVRLFRRQGADNVLWVWSPNIDNSGQFPFRKYYPGDAWVDWVGPDGFNWGLRNEWNSFTKVFAKTYRSLRHLSSRPMLICETGSSEHGGPKARWVSRALRTEIPRFGRIEGVVWFNERFNGIDPRVNSSRSALRAFRAAAASPRYSLTRQLLLLASPNRLRPPSGGAASSAVR
jgi:Glycosyl hydrolase family 26